MAIDGLVIRRIAFDIAREVDRVVGVRVDRETFRIRVEDDAEDRLVGVDQGVWLDRS